MSNYCGFFYGTILAYKIVSISATQWRVVDETVNSKKQLWALSTIGSIACFILNDCILAVSTASFVNPVFTGRMHYMAEVGAE